MKIFEIVLNDITIERFQVANDVVIRGASTDPADWLLYDEIERQGNQYFVTREDGSTIQFSRQDVTFIDSYDELGTIGRTVGVTDWAGWDSDTRKPT